MNGPKLNFKFVKLKGFRANIKNVI